MPAAVRVRPHQAALVGLRRMVWPEIERLLVALGRSKPAVPDTASFSGSSHVGLAYGCRSGEPHRFSEAVIYGAVARASIGWIAANPQGRWGENQADCGKNSA